MPRYIDADEIAEYIICDDGGGMGCEMGNPIKNDVRPIARMVVTSWGRNRKWQLKYLSAVLLAHIGASLRRTIEKPLPKA